MEENEKINDDFIYDYLSSEIKYKKAHENGKMEFSNKKIYDICEDTNLTSIDPLICYLKIMKKKVF